MNDTGLKPTQRRILEAVSRVVVREGVGDLTLEAVAAEAGVSKGGLLYHYPSKGALIRGLLEFFLESFERDITARRVGEGPGSWTRAYIEASLADTGSEAAVTGEAGLNAGILAAIALDPSLLQPVRERYAVWQARLEADGVEPELATILALAADGLWMSELLGISHLDPGQRERVAEKMLRLVAGEEE